MHLNPTCGSPCALLAGLLCIRPRWYEPFVYLLKHAHLVLTDSGGIQEEAPSLGKPVLVMRDVTERRGRGGGGTGGADIPASLPGRRVGWKTQRIMPWPVRPYGMVRPVNRLWMCCGTMDEIRK